MAERSRVLSWLVVTIAAAALGVVAPGPASASCAGPMLGLAQSPAGRASDGPPAAVRRGEGLVVTGTWFKDGCADTIAYTAGCDPQPTQTETERPLTGVRLALSQDQRAWTLGVADAGSGPDFAVQWTIRIPADARVGLSTLTADAATLTVDVQP